MEWARTFSGALPCSELLKDYGIKGPLDEDKLNLLREERLALVLASEVSFTLFYISFHRLKKTNNFGQIMNMKKLNQSLMLQT
jgi:hypothetical protein